MLTLATTRSFLRGWLLLALGAAACVGTPTPEPPDLLPRPEILIARTTSFPPEIAVDNALAPIDFLAPAGAVVANADVWIVNLDDPDSAPITVRAAANGSFQTTITNGHVGDRIRVVARTAERHSPPLDLELVQTPPMDAGLANLAPDALTCARVSPEDDVTVVVGAESTTRHFVVDNGCAEAIAVERAQLRFGDQGIELGSLPARIAAGQQVELEITFAARASGGTRADIVLLDLATSTARSRRGLGVWGIVPR